MPAIAAILPYIALAGAVVAVDGYVKSEEARKNAGEAASRAKVAQEKQQSEAKAQNAQAAAAERRRQIREERVRRARILQSSENTGVEGSSGEVGSLGAIDTMFSTAVGENAGKIASADRTSGYVQDQANAQFSFNQAQSDMQAGQSQMNLGASIFSQSGGLSSVDKLFNPPAPK